MLHSDTLTLTFMLHSDTTFRLSSRLRGTLSLRRLQSVIAGEGVANAQLVGVKGAMAALMRQLRHPSCNCRRNTFSEILLHISGRLSGLRRAFR